MLVLRQKKRMKTLRWECYGSHAISVEQKTQQSKIMYIHCWTIVSMINPTLIWKNFYQISSTFFPVAVSYIMGWKRTSEMKWSEVKRSFHFFVMHTCYWFIVKQRCHVGLLVLCINRATIGRKICSYPKKLAITYCCNLTALTASNYSQGTGLPKYNFHSTQTTEKVWYLNMLGKDLLINVR